MMGEFFSKAKEVFRDKRRDQICASLQALGVDAILAERGRVEEEVRGLFSVSSSLGIIGVSGSPIRWINVRKVTSGQYTAYYTDYGVPDPRLGLDSPGVLINTVRVKNFPLFGEVVDLCWKGSDSDLGIVGRLNSDAQLKQPIMKSGDMRIEAVSKYNCWIISTKNYPFLSRELWDCYETIAEHLLAGLNPADADAYYNRGDAYSEIGEYEKAVADYNKAIQVDPNDADAYYNRGCTYGEMGEYDKAIADFNKAIELAPNDADAYYNRGCAYSEKGEAPEAVNDLEKCIGLSTDAELTKAAQLELRKVKKSP